MPDQTAPVAITDFTVGVDNTVTLIESIASSQSFPLTVTMADNPGGTGVEKAIFTYRFEDPDGDIKDTISMRPSWSFSDEVSINGDETTFTDTFSVPRKSPLGTWNFIHSRPIGTSFFGK
jgi:hypothetical protein